MTWNMRLAFAAFAPALLLVGCEHHGGKSPEERLTPVAELGDEDEVSIASQEPEAAPAADTSGIDQDPVTSELADLPADAPAPSAPAEKPKAKKPPTTASAVDTPMPQPDVAPPAQAASDPSIDELINGTGAAAEPAEPEVAGWDDGLDDPEE